MIKVGIRGAISDSLRSLPEGESAVFEPGAREGSIRTLAHSLNIRVQVKTLSNGSISVTRMPDTNKNKLPMKITTLKNV